MMRSMLYEAAQILLVRSTKWSWLKAWAMKIARTAEVSCQTEDQFVMHRDERFLWKDQASTRFVPDHHYRHRDYCATNRSDQRINRKPLGDGLRSARASAQTDGANDAHRCELRHNRPLRVLVLYPRQQATVITAALTAGATRPLSPLKI
jgi:hypothetical protein